MLAVLVVSVPAHAALLRLRLENVATGMGVVVTDNGAGDLNPLVGALTISQVLDAGFAVNVVTGVSQPITPDQLDLNSINVNTSGAGTLRMTLEDSGFEAGNTGVSVIAAVGGVLTAPAGSTATFGAWASPSNLTPALGPDQSVLGLLGPIGAIPAGSIAIFDPLVVVGSGAFSATDGAAFVTQGAYSLFSRAEIRFTGAGSVSFNEIIRVPEPGTLGLLSFALLGLGLTTLRQRPGSVQAA